MHDGDSNPRETTISKRATQITPPPIKQYFITTTAVTFFHANNTPPLCPPFSAHKHTAQTAIMTNQV